MRVFANGLFVTPTGIVAGDLLVEGEQIVSIGKNIRPSGAEVIDLGGKYVLPGVVDPEVHLGVHRSLRDDIITESRAAIANGVTTWNLQLVSPAIRPEYKEKKDLEDVVAFSEVFPTFLELNQNTSMVDFYFTPIINTDAQAEDIPTLAEHFGVTSCKFYLHMMRGMETAHLWEAQRKAGFFGFDDGTIWIALEHMARLGRAALVSFHPENWNICRVFEDRLRKSGRTDMAAWNARSPHFCEAGHVHNYAYYCKVAGVPMYVQHVTTPETVEEIAKARADGVEIYGQSNPCYLTLPDSTWKLNVPLRSSETNEKMWQFLKPGAIDCLGSDHVNHGVPRSQMETDNVWTTISGFSSRIEALLPVMLSEGVSRGRISLSDVARLMSEAPARIWGIYPKKGALQIGSDADFVVVDMEKTVELQPHMLYTSAGWSIFEGWQFRGWPIMTVLRGTICARWSEETGRNEIVSEPAGQYLPRDPGSDSLAARQLA